MSRRLAVLLTGIALILFSFQNCGRSGFQTYSEDALLSSSVAGLSPGGTASAPIAYDVGLDTIAYNSCVPSVKGSSNYFTLRASAGGTKGGVRLTSDFMSSAASTLKPILGNPDVLDVQYKELIEKTNAGLEAQVALRSVSDLRAAYTGAVQNGIWGTFDYLVDDAWMTPIVDSARRKNNAWVGYSAQAPQGANRLDFNFSQDFPASDYWSSMLNAQQFRTCVVQGCQNYGQFNIAVGFSEPSSNTLIRSPASYTNAQTKAYGRGYQLHFGYPSNIAGTGLRVVKGITEYNMVDNTQVVENNAATQWSCMEIPIMSSMQRGSSTQPQTSSVDNRFATTDANHYLCNPMTGNFAASIYNQVNLAKIREILPPSQWQLGYQNFAGTTRLCVVPIGMDCYPTAETFPNYNSTGQSNPYPYYVEYDPTRSCINEDNMATQLTRTDTGAWSGVCAHYVTICTKQ